MTLGPSNDRVPKDELAYATRVAKRNAEFLSMTPAQQRVRIAEETIAALDAEEFAAESMVYLIADGDDPNSACTGCALGLIFAALCRLGGSQKRTRFAVHMREELGPYFLDDTLKEIESAFEGWGEVQMVGWPKGDKAKATAAFNAGIGDPNERLRRIMRNIIKHKGTFVPEDRPSKTPRRGARTGARGRSAS